MDGVLTTNYAGVTSGTSSPTVEHLNFNGTFAQPVYNIQAHTRHADGIVFTDSVSYLQANGYFADPESAPSYLGVPTPRSMRMRR